MTAIQSDVINETKMGMSAYQIMHCQMLTKG